MIDWIETSEKLPNENDTVMIITIDACGYNAVYKDNKFISGDKIIQLEDVKFWKTTTPNASFESEIKKKCRSCGRRR